MKKTEMSFMDGFTEGAAKAKKAKAEKEGQAYKVFDWDYAAEIIKNTIEDHPDLIAEAGLQNDWDHTGGIIYQDGEPYVEDYTYLGSLWAAPTLILTYDGKEQQEIPCYVTGETRFQSGSKWDEQSLAILNS